MLDGVSIDIDAGLNGLMTIRSGVFAETNTAGLDGLGLIYQSVICAMEVAAPMLLDSKTMAR